MWFALLDQYAKFVTFEVVGRHVAAAERLTVDDYVPADVAYLQHLRED